MKMSPGNIDLFAKGTIVEVSSADGWFPGGWFVAKVLDPPPPSPTAPGKMTFLVEYQSLLYGSKLLRKRVDIKFVRPLPPPPPNDDGQEQQRFQVNDVVDAYRNDGWWVGVVSKVWKEEEPMEYLVLLENPSRIMNFRSSELRFHLDWVGNKWVQPQKQNKMSSKGVEKRGMQMEAETSSEKRKRGTHVKFLPKGKECGGSQGSVDKIIVEDSSTTGAATVDNMSYENRNLLSLESSPVLRGKECGGVEGVDKIIVEDSTTGAATVDNMPYENQNLRLLESSPVLRVKECGGADGVVDKIIVEDSSTTGAAMVDNMSYKNQNLQFLESSPVLRFVQSLEEFQLMPQKPHFRPLDECEEVYREGLALKHMMTFVNVVKRTSKLQINASRSIIDSLLKCLPELESHGFNVTDVRRRLLKLQTAKEIQEHLQTKLEKVKCEIKMRTHEVTKINAELIDAIKEIKVLEEKKARLVSMNEENDSEIAKLKSSDSLLNEHIQNVEHDFASISTLPWR
ncbi:hypothetical protein Ddye_011391 [Dipteronia dyeriana]|uniref:Agenet domain-containing protein n=1 Tax=Dipteronia dyeriana TaxID=168575 RepID=A0AAE0CGW1_9ROSI|nr:hypothetical protein Ddye_011391 [Dipteronia dyeriana]